MKTQGRFEQLNLELHELNHAQPQRQEIAVALLSAASAMVLHINMSLPSKQLLVFLNKRSGMGKKKKRGLYVLSSVELFLSCVTFQECVGHSKNNETMRIITFLDLSSGKKSTICCPLLKEIQSVD